jgi:hypothetical protein
MPRSHSVREAVNEAEIYQALTEATRGYGGVTRFARRLGVSRQYINNMLYAGARISTAVGAKLGWELRWVRTQK